MTRFHRTFGLLMGTVILMGSSLVCRADDQAPAPSPAAPVTVQELHSQPPSGSTEKINWLWKVGVPVGLFAFVKVRDYVFANYVKLEAMPAIVDKKILENLLPDHVEPVSSLTDTEGSQSTSARHEKNFREPAFTPASQETAAFAGSANS